MIPMESIRKLSDSYRDIQEAKFDINQVIKDLGGNFAGSNDDQMKAVQLLKGLALSDDPKANEFMEKLDAATTQISQEMSESLVEYGLSASIKKKQKKHKAFTKHMLKKKKKKMKREEIDEASFNWKPVKKGQSSAKITVSKNDVEKVLDYISDNESQYDIDDIDKDEVTGTGSQSYSAGSIYLFGDDAGDFGIDIAKNFRKVKVLGESKESKSLIDLLNNIKNGGKIEDTDLTEEDVNGILDFYENTLDSTGQKEFNKMSITKIQSTMKKLGL